jgi:hypothetical protein
MKHILNEEINQIKYLFNYKKGIVISEQSADKVTNFTVKNIQDKLIQLGYKDILSNQGKIKNPSDGKFGPATMAAITKAIQDSKTQAPVSTTDTAKTTPTTTTTATADTTTATAPTTSPTTATAPTTSPSTAATTPANTTKPTQTEQWCEKNTILDDEKCYSVVGMKYEDAERKVRNDAKKDGEHRFKRDEFWDDNSKTLIRIYGSKSRTSKEIEKRNIQKQQTNVVPKPSYSTRDVKQSLDDNV